MTKLSVNINKIATLRNARGGDIPNVVQFAKDIQEFGAQGVTIHPRPDQRHIRYRDAYDLKPEISLKSSKNNKYTSISIKVFIDSPEEIVKRYKEVGDKIKGVISL